MNRLNYSYGLVNRKTNGFNDCATVTSVRPAWTYPIKDMRKPTWIPYRGLARMGVVAAILFIALFLGAFDWIPDILK